MKKKTRFTQDDVGKRMFYGSCRAIIVKVDSDENGFALVLNEKYDAIDVHISDVVSFGEKIKI